MLFRSESKKIHFATTNDKSDADVDAVMWKGDIVAVAEVKARNMTIAQLLKFGSYLVTFSKLQKLRNVSMSLRCRGILLVFLIPESKIVWWNICNSNGDWLCDTKVERTQTQATCNGGIAIRDNAYLPVSLMKC